jgi:peptidoglycan-associated lipoprotein
MRKNHTWATLLIALITLTGVACTKKVPMSKAPAPPVAAPVTASAPASQPAAVSRPAASTPVASAPASRYPDAATRARIDQLLARISDAYFDYDKFSLRPDAVKTLQADSVELRNILVQYPDYKLQIEGYCDERGSAEYNMALGDRRAAAAKTYLVEVGIPSAQLSVVSYGKEHPICEEHDEACWQKNRRIHVVALASNR